MPFPVRPPMVRRGNAAGPSIALHERMIVGSLGT